MLGINIMRASSGEKSFILSNSSDVNLFAVAGAPTKSGKFIFVIPENVVIGQVSAAAAILFGNFPAGSKVTLVNSGYIVGRSGAGGTSTNAGQAGGTAILCNNAGITGSIINQSKGFILAGGGGGGSGGRGGVGGAGGAFVANIGQTEERFTGFYSDSYEINTYGSFAGWTSVFWDGVRVRQGNTGGSTQMDIYRAGSYQGSASFGDGGGNYYSVIKDLSTTYPGGAGGAGGYGGTGGNGAGYRNGVIVSSGDSQTLGSAGGAGSNGAAGTSGSGSGGSGGIGGKGGDGGGFGSSGQSGVTGTIGTAGSNSSQNNGAQPPAPENPYAGGSAGSAMQLTTAITYSNGGSIVGNVIQ